MSMKYSIDGLRVNHMLMTRSQASCAFLPGTILVINIEILDSWA